MATSFAVLGRRVSAVCLVLIMVATSGAVITGGAGGPASGSSVLSSVEALSLSMVNSTTVLNETFDSPGSLDPGWSFWQATSISYNHFAVESGTLMATDSGSYVVDDSLNARANWTRAVGYSGAMEVSFDIYLPSQSESKEGAYGQFLGLILYDSSGQPALIMRWLMDLWEGAPSGWSYINNQSRWGGICQFSAGWHSVSFLMSKNSSTWTAAFDGSVYTGLTYTTANSGFDMSRLSFVNGLREEVTTINVDDLWIIVSDLVEPPLNTPPVASLEVTPTVGVPGTVFTADASSSYDAEDGVNLSYSYDWEGDGVIDYYSFGPPIPVGFTYALVGSYWPTVLVLDSGGLCDNATQMVVVGGRAPFADAGPDQFVPLGSQVMLDGSGSFDSDGEIVSYEWRFIDGAEVVLHGMYAFYDFMTVWQYPYEVTLTVTDASGLAATDTMLVTVWDDPVKVIRTKSDGAGGSYTWGWNAPYEGKWSLVMLNHGLKSVSLEFRHVFPGGYSILYQQVIRFDDRKTIPKPVWSEPINVWAGGYFEVTATPSGRMRASVLISNIFNSSNQAPMASFSHSTDGLSASFDSSGSFDPLLDPLKFVWDFGDGSKSYGAQATHEYQASGVYLVSLKAIDPSGLYDIYARNVSVSTIEPVGPPEKTMTVYDMFQEPWGEWWEPRWSLYGWLKVLTDEPGMNTVMCFPWNPDRLQAIIYAPSRYAIDARNQTAISLTRPEFIPVVNASSSSGSAMMGLYFQYLDMDWWNSYWVPAWGGEPDWVGDDLMSTGANDGWLLGTQYSLLMDRSAANRLMGLPADADPASWWSANELSFEAMWTNWLLYEGNSRLDIWCAYEWPLDLFGTYADLVENPDGTLVLEVDIISWGYEILMTRWLTEAGICNTEPWYEDFSMTVQYSEGVAQLSMDAVAQLSLHAVKANGTVDGSAWVWEPFHADYVVRSGHPSEFAPYVPLRYQSWNAGDPCFGTDVGYEYTPTWFNLSETDKLVFMLPSFAPGYKGVGLTEQDIVDIWNGDLSPAYEIMRNGSMSLGYSVTGWPEGTGIDLDMLYNPWPRILTIVGPVDFDNYRHTADGPLYHGAPWIEFDVTETGTPPEESGPRSFVVYDMFQEPFGWWWERRNEYYGSDFILSQSPGASTDLMLPLRSTTYLYQGLIYAPYRYAVHAEDQLGLSVDAPLFMPTYGPEVPGASADLDISFQYVAPTGIWIDYWLPTWGSAPNWPGDDWPFSSGSDGYNLGVVYTVTMNREAALQWLGMPQSADVASWWTSNNASYTSSWVGWIENQGNVVYDIYCGYEWVYEINGGTWMFLDEDEATGNVTLSIGHLVWGYEILMTRWLAAGDLSPLEGFFEDFSLHAEYSKYTATVDLDCVVQYSLHAVRANGTADGASWAWEPNRVDYVYKLGHPSDYAPYRIMKYQSWNAGDVWFGQQVPYETTPGWFNLTANDSLVFQLPTGTVPGYKGVGLLQADYDKVSLGDVSSFYGIMANGTMDLGYFITAWPPGSGIDLAPLYDGVTKVLSIPGTANFSNFMHKPTGVLYHGAPWIEFDVVSS